MAVVSQAAPAEAGCPVSMLLLPGTDLPPAFMPAVSKGRLSKWGYLEGTTDPLEVEKNWIAGYGTASSTSGPSLLAGGVFCPPPALGLCKVTGVRGQVSFTELLQSKGLTGLE